MTIEENAQVVFAAYGDVAQASVPGEGVVFFIPPSVLEALFGDEYAERVVKAWTQAGTLEQVVDDLALEVAAGRASLHGTGTRDDPYSIEVERGERSCPDC